MVPNSSRASPGKNIAALKFVPASMMCSTGRVFLPGRIVGNQTRSSSIR